MNAPPPPIPPQPPRRAVLLVWWTIWTAIVCGLIVIYVVLGPDSPAAVARQARAQPEAAMVYVGLALVLGSSAVRWLLFPRCTDHRRALRIFVIGVALAEGCGILGIFVSAQPTALFAVSLAALAQWAPLSLGRLLPVEPARRRTL